MLAYGRSSDCVTNEDAGAWAPASVVFIHHPLNAGAGIRT